jgi:hypothetical protein
VYLAFPGIVEITRTYKEICFVLQLAPVFIWRVLSYVTTCFGGFVPFVLSLFSLCSYGGWPRSKY